MNIMVTDLYEALISAGADEAKARKAAEGLSSGTLTLEPRVARLEASVTHIEHDIQDMKIDIRELRSDTSSVKERLTRLEEKVTHLPGKGFIVSGLLTALAVIAALIVFQNQIQSLAGQGPRTISAQP